MHRPISDELEADINLMCETALQLREEMTDPTMKARIDLALNDLKEIPHLFEAEDTMRQVLKLPSVRIREVVQARDKYGPGAIYRSGGW